jgi:hypothetical protein
MIYTMTTVLQRTHQTHNGAANMSSFTAGRIVHGLITLPAGSRILVVVPSHTYMKRVISEVLANTVSLTGAKVDFNLIQGTLSMGGSTAYFVTSESKILGMEVSQLICSEFSTYPADFMALAATRVRKKRPLAKVQPQGLPNLSEQPLC